MAIPGSVVAIGKLITPGGAQGPGGASGGSAYTTISVAPFTVPAYGSTIIVNMVDTNWLAIGEWVYIDDAGGPGVAGQLQVQSKTASTVTLLNSLAPTGTPPLASPTTAGLLTQVSGSTNDFVDGTNNCQPITPQITAVRLRSFNAIGNPNFEVDQRLCGAATVAANVPTQDRWSRYTTGSMVISCQQAAVGVPIPGTDFLISQSAHRIQVQTSQASLAAGDYFQIVQTIEGPNHREMSGAHSLSLLVRPSVANLKFSIVLSDPTSSLSLVKLCNAGTVGAWNLIQLPNLPAMTGGTFSAAPGTAGHVLHIVLACGTTYMAPAADVWVSGNFLGVPGISNFAANPVNSTFDIAFIQHEPLPVCSQLIDKPFVQNLDECLRYYQKSCHYSTLPLQNWDGLLGMLIVSGQTYIRSLIRFPKRMAKMPANLWTCGISPSTNQVYLDAIPGNVAVAVGSPFVLTDSGVSQMQLNASAPASGSLNVIGGWAVDTGW